MIAWYAVYRCIQHANDFAEYLVALTGFILHKIAGCNNRIRTAAAGCYLVDNLAQCMERIYTAHPRVRMGMQMGVGDM